MFRTMDVQASGAFLVDEALARLAADPEELDRARRRFNMSPPAYASPSGTTTEFPSPGTPRTRLRAIRESRLWLAHEASKPSSQFSAETRKERERILERHRTHPGEGPSGAPLIDLAADIVRKRWVEQGIWNESWTSDACGRWKHEEPLKPPPQRRASGEMAPGRQDMSRPAPQETGTEAEQVSTQPSEEEIRSREASRPFHQFIYQVNKERERLTDQQSVKDVAADINTTAYENVKQLWKKRQIWSPAWTVLPGMTWRHEHPREEDTLGDVSPIELLMPEGIGIAFIPQRNCAELSPVRATSEERCPQSPCVRQSSPEEPILQQPDTEMTDAPRTTPESKRDDLAVEGTSASRPPMETTSTPGEQGENQDSPPPPTQTSPKTAKDLPRLKTEEASSLAQQAPNPKASKPRGRRRRRNRKTSETELDGDSTAATYQQRRSMRTRRGAKDQPEDIHPRIDKSAASKTRKPCADDAPPDASVKSQGVTKRRSPRKKPDV
ncbi:hypothetical protein E4U42_007069 [Claviceps africana]|uniref:Uncharacterized protein n=1 Tax=Claviceps africana TaxID=83212 RepID=A0A8K0NGC5_9HYPO|nr:hypothetical protein E4U42_007069 [Claviceps africana]